MEARKENRGEAVLGQLAAPRDGVDAAVGGLLDGALPAGRVLARERQHVLGDLQRDLDGLRVALAGDDHLEEHGVARRGERRADLDVRGGRRRERERQYGGNGEGEPDHRSRNVHEPRCV